VIGSLEERETIMRDRPDDHTPQVKVVPASAAHRQAIVAARRTQIGHARAAVRHQLADSQRHRQQISFALVRLRRRLLVFRSEVRNRLQQIGIAASTRRTGKKVGIANAPPSA
jgi:hypothetical protein